MHRGHFTIDKIAVRVDGVEIHEERLVGLRGGWNSVGDLGQPGGVLAIALSCCYLSCFALPCFNVVPH